LNSLHTNNAGSDFQIIAVSMVGWSGCTANSQIWSTAQAWGSLYGIAAASSVPAYYYPSGSLSFGTSWVFDRTGKLLWTGPGTQVTDTMVQGWISSSGGGGGGGGGGGNNPPVANAGANQNVFEGATVVLSGSGSSDPDGDTLSYSWTQTAGQTVSLQGANTVSASFVAPTVGAVRVYTFRLTVSDGKGGTDTDDVTITVTPSNYPPNANAGPDQGAMFGASVMLNGTGSTDPDNDPLNYSWTQVGGASVTLSNANTPSPSFTAPGVNAVLEFELTVTDTSAASDTDRVIVHVNATGTIPVNMSGKGGGGAGCASGSGSSYALFLVVALLGLATLPRRRRA